MPENISLQSIVGKRGIPTPYVKKVILSPGMQPSGMDMDFGESLTSQGLIIKVELSLADIKRRGKFQWVTDERLQKYLRIRVIESRNPELTKMLADGGLTAAKLKRAKRDYNFREKVLSLRPDKDIESVDKYRQRRNTYVYMFPYEAEFFIPNLNPSHLAYFCSCYMDTIALTRDFGSNFKNRRFREVQGYISGDLIINNGQPVSSASVYKLPNGDIHPGAVHFHRTPSGGNYMAGPRHTDIPHPVLDRQQIPNFKIQDRRILSMLDDLEFNLTPADDAQQKIRKLRTNKSANDPLFRKVPNFISEAFVSRDLDGKPNVMFSVDTHRVLMEKGQFGKILNTENSELIRKIAQTSRITSFKLFRKRVRKNRLTENPRSQYKAFNEDTKRELIVHNSEKIAGQFRRKSYRRDKDGDEDKEVRIGFVKEIDLMNVDRLRTFSCTDFSMRKVTDGTYQYVAEVEMEDGTLEFVLDTLRKLRRHKKNLIRYYNESTLPRNYNTNANKFTKNFIDLNNRRYPQLPDNEINNVPNLQRQKRNPRNSSNSPWNRSIVTMLEALSALTNLSDDNVAFVASNLHAMINPNTGTPQGIEKFIKTYERLENKVRRLLNSRGVGNTEFDVNVKSSIHKERFKKSKIKVRKRFKEVFDSDTQKGVGYDFLGGRKANRGGVREISLNFFINRTTRENDKYFTGDLSYASNPILDLATSRYAYLSPANVRYGVKTLRILGSGKALWNKSRYNSATSVIASMKIDPTREELSAPVGTAKNLEGPRGLKETLSRNILASHGIIIETPELLPKLRKSKEEIDSEDIVGAEVLTDMTAQALDVIDEDFQEEAEILEEEETRVRRKFDPLNTLFVEKLINKDSSDVFKVAQKRGVSPGLRGFDLRKGDNILEILYRDKRGMSNNIRNLPNQIKSLFLATRPNAVNRWQDAGVDFLLKSDTYEMLRYNHFMLQKIEYLSGFETTEIDGRQITRPLFSLMNPNDIVPRPGKNLLCRMTTYKNSKVYADIPKELSLPIRDEYFLIKFGEEPVGLSDEEEALTETVEPDASIDRAARRLARTTSLDRTARRIMSILIEKENRAQSYYQYSSTVFVKQPRDLIQEGAEIEQQRQDTSATTTSRAVRTSATRRATTTTPARGTARTTITTSTPRGGGTTGGGGY